MRLDRGAGETVTANLETAVAGHSGAKDAGSVAQAGSVPRERSAGKNTNISYCNLNVKLLKTHFVMVKNSKGGAVSFPEGVC